MADISEKARAFFREHGDLINLQGKFQTRAALEAYAQRQGIVLPENASEFLIAQQEIKQDEPAELPNEPAGHKEGNRSHAEKEVPRPARADIGQSYRNAVENTVADWNRANRNNPDAQFKGEVFEWDKDGKLILNLKAAEKIPELAKRGEDIVTAMHGEQEVRRYQQWRSLNSEEQEAIMRLSEQEQALRPTNPAELKQSIARRVETATNRQIIAMQVADRQQGITRLAGKSWYEKEISTPQLTKVAQQQAIGQYLLQNKNNRRAIREAMRDPELKPLIEGYQAQEKEALRKAQEQERLRKIRSPKNDPRFQQFQTATSSTIDGEVARRAKNLEDLAQRSRAKGLTVRTMTVHDIRKDARQMTEIRTERAALDNWMRRNPDQARRYARRDPNIKAAYERYQSQQALAKKQYEEAQKLIKKRGLLGRAWRRVRPIKRVYLPLPGQTAPDAVLPSRWQRMTSPLGRFGKRFDPLRNAYDDFRDWRDRVYDKYSPTRFIPRGYERLKDRFQQTRLGKWLKTKRDRHLERMDRLANWWDRMSPARRLQRRFRNSNFYKKTFGRYNAFRSRFSAWNPYTRLKRWLRNLRKRITDAIKNAIKNAIKGAFKALGRGIAQGARFMAPILGRALKNLGSAAARGARRLANRAVSGAANAMSKMAEQLARIAAQLVAQTLARIAAAGLLANPVTWVVIGLGLIVLFVFIMLTSPSEETPPTVIPPPSTIASVTIDKEAEKPSVGNDEVIRYTITVKPQGAADDIAITDIVPANATFDSADHQPQITEGPDGITILTWSLKEIQSQRSSPPSESSPPSPSGFDLNKFNGYGFPQPQEPNPVALDQEGLRRWKEFGLSPTLKAANALEIDPGIIGFWSFYEDINYDISFDNCQDGEYDPNTPCPSNNWQVGVGVRPAETLNYLKGAFTTMYGNSDDETIQRVGQGVIDKINSRGLKGKITYPSTSFPKTSLQSLIDTFGENESRAWIATLMKDEAIGVYILGRIFSNTLGPTFADSIIYGPFYDKQKIINTIKAVYGSGLTGEGEEGTTPPLTLQPQTITLILRPKPDAKNTYVVNKVRAEVVGGATAGDCVITQVGTPDASVPKPTCPSESGQQPGPPGQPPSDTTPGQFGFPLKDGADVVTSINTEMASYAGDYENCMQGTCHGEHAGLDIMTPIHGRGEVVAVADGQVIAAGGDASQCPGIDWGCRVEILHDDGKTTSAYSHIDPTVAVNGVVKKGERIGYVHIWPDSYGEGMDHLHFELLNEQRYNINPRNHYPELSRFGAAADYTPNVREHTARRGYPWIEDGREFGNMFQKHPPCPAPINNDTDCWAH